MFSYILLYNNILNEISFFTVKRLPNAQYYYYYHHRIRIHIKYTHIRFQDLETSRKETLYVVDNNNNNNISSYIILYIYETNSCE